VKTSTPVFTCSSPARRKVCISVEQLDDGGFSGIVTVSENDYSTWLTSCRSESVTDAISNLVEALGEYLDARDSAEE
jgi:hypothetical protein